MPGNHFGRHLLRLSSMRTCGCCWAPRRRTGWTPASLLLKPSPPPSTCSCSLSFSSFPLSSYSPVYLCFLLSVFLFFPPQTLPSSPPKPDPPFFLSYPYPVRPSIPHPVSPVPLPPTRPFPSRPASLRSPSLLSLLCVPCPCVPPQPRGSGCRIIKAREPGAGAPGGIPPRGRSRSAGPPTHNTALHCRGSGCPHITLGGRVGGRGGLGWTPSLGAVSYTHLTLPTILLV